MWTLKRDIELVYDMDEVMFGLVRYAEVSLSLCGLPTSTFGRTDRPLASTAVSCSI